MGISEGIQRALRSKAPGAAAKGLLRQSVRVGKEWSVQQPLPPNKRSLRLDGLVSTVRNNSAAFAKKLGASTTNHLYGLGLKKGYEEGDDVQYRRKIQFRRRFPKTTKESAGFGPALATILEVLETPTTIVDRANRLPGLNAKKADLLFRGVSRAKRLNAIRSMAKAGHPRAAMVADRTTVLDKMPHLRPKRDYAW